MVMALIKRMRQLGLTRYLMLLAAYLSLISCASSPEVTEIDYPDEAEIATLIAETVTQMAVNNLETTASPYVITKPAEQDLTQPPMDTPEEPVPTHTVTLPYPFVYPTETGTPTTTATGELPENATAGASTVEPTPQATPTEEAALQAGIPGLNLGDMVDQVAGIGFECSQPYLLDAETIVECNYETTDFKYTVTMWGSTTDTVDLIEAVAFYFGDLDYTELTSIIFELLVATTYQGTASEEARVWIIETLPEIQVLGDEATQFFEGVRYYLYAFPSAHVLEIGSSR